MNEPTNDTDVYRLGVTMPDAPSPESSLCTHVGIRPVRTKAGASPNFEMFKKQGDLVAALWSLAPLRTYTYDP